MVMWPTQQLFKLLISFMRKISSWFVCVFSPSLLLDELYQLFQFVPLLPLKRFAGFFPFSFTPSLAPPHPASPSVLLSSPNGFILQPVNNWSELSTDNFLRMKSLSITWYDFFFFLKLKSVSVLINTMQNGSFHIWCTNQIILVKPVQSHWF